MAYYNCGGVYTTQNSNVVVDTASGAVANFQTPLAMPLLKTRFDFKATQDLHGQSGPYPAGGSAQKWDEETVNGYLSSTDGSFISHNTSICSKNFNPILPSTSYYMYKGSSVPVAYIYWYDSNQDFISRDALANLVVTTPSNAAYFKISCYGYGATYKNDISINYPATDTAYHPYSNICPIEGVSEINLTHCHKNLYQYDESKVSTGTTASNTTRAYMPLGVKGPGTFTFKATLKSGQEPTIHFINIGKLKDGIITVFQSFIQAANLFERTISYNDGDEIVLVSASEVTYSVTSSLPRYDIQIEVGSQATTYEPYNGSTTLINLGGTYYGGYVSQDKDGKRELVVTHGYASYDLSKQPYTTANGFDGWLIYRAQRAENNPNSKDGKLCNCCPEYKYAEGTLGREHYYVTGGAFVVYLNENTYRNGFLEYTYPLETPIVIDLADGQPIKTLPGVNNIFADTGDTYLQFRKIG